MLRVPRKKPAAPLERTVRKAIIDTLNSLPHTMALGLAAGPFQQPGLPDILCVVSGRAMFVEVKRPGKTPTPRQAAMLARLSRAKALAAVAFTVKDAVKLWMEAAADAGLTVDEIAMALRNALSEAVLSDLESAPGMERIA